MSQKSRQYAPNPVGMICVSLCLHLAAVFIFNYSEIFKPALHEATPYYVDIVSLPALDSAPANPEPLPAPAPVAASSAVKPPSLSAKPVMSLPAKTAAPVPTSPLATPVQDSRDQEAGEVARRISRLEYNAEAKHQAEALASLQKRVADKKGSGNVAAVGSNKGADYAAYIQSRLKDALATTLVYRSKAPEAAVHIYIDKKGKIIRYVMERPSTDKIFNDSVIRAIEKAKVNFPPTPTAAGFDKLYVFSPQEVTK